jgi:hypothetical protein
MDRNEAKRGMRSPEDAEKGTNGREYGRCMCARANPPTMREEIDPNERSRQRAHWAVSSTLYATIKSDRKGKARAMASVRAAYRFWTDGQCLYFLT